MSQAADDVLDVTVNDVYMGLFAVQTEPVKRGIAAKALQMAEVLLSQVLADNVEEMNEVCMRFEAANSRAMERPKESHEMKALKAYLEAAPKEQAVLHNKIINISKRNNFLHNLNKEVPDEDMLLNTKTYMWPEKIQPVLDSAMERILSQEEKMEDALRARQKKYEDDVQLTTEELRSFQQCGDAKYVAQYLQQAMKLQVQLEGLQEELAMINEQEEIFGWNPTVNPQVSLHSLRMYVCEHMLLFSMAQGQEDLVSLRPDIQ